MQPTARAPFVHDEAHGRAYTQPPQPQQSAARGTADAAQRRQQWDARLASFQRGLDHVMRCGAGDACGSSLCHATRRLMRTYATHDCISPPGPGAAPSTTNNATTHECKVCKLWGYILTKNTPAATRVGAGHGAAPGGRVGGVPQPLVLPPLTCGLAHSRGARIARGGLLAAGPPRRVVVTPELIKATAKRV